MKLLATRLQRSIEGNPRFHALEHGDDEHLGTLYVGDEGNPEVDGHPASPIPVRRNAEGRDAPGAADAHRDVDDEIEEAVAEVAGHGHHLTRDVSLLLEMINIKF